MLQALPRRCRTLRPRLAQRASLAVTTTAAARRSLVTLAIETSCDDTAVAVLSRSRPGPGRRSATTRLLFNERVSSDNRAFRGINPVVAVAGHNGSLAPLVQRALASLPDCRDADGEGNEKKRKKKRVPDFVCVTRGPGIMANLAVGLNMAKGLAVAWGVPLVGVHHMQAHALTPRLVRALETEEEYDEEEEEEDDGGGGGGGGGGQTNAREDKGRGPHFPFLSLLVSGGHTQLVHSASLTTHRIVATTGDIAIGNLLDQAARVILPASVLDSSPDVMYGRRLESFAFPPGADSPRDYAAFFQPAASRGQEMLDVAPAEGYPWSIPLPFRNSRALAFSFASIHMHAHRIAASFSSSSSPSSSGSDIPERRALARHTLRAAFQHLASRLVLALEDLPELRSSRTLVVAGGVASNRFLMHVLRATLAARGLAHLRIVAPPPDLCTDNAAMVAWAGMEMYEAGHCSDLSVRPIAKWPMDPEVGGGILGVDGWLRRDGEEVK